MQLNFLGRAELEKVAVDITRYAKTKKANYCLKNINLRAGVSSGMAFNIYKAFRVQKQTSARRVQKHGSTQKYHFKNVKIQLKTPRQSGKF